MKIFSLETQYAEDIAENTSNRLHGYDYSQSAGYFITLVANKRKVLFGKLISEQIELSPIGQIVREEWLRTGDLRSDITLDEFVIMPDHFHAILLLMKSLKMRMA